MQFQDRLNGNLPEKEKLKNLIEGHRIFALLNVSSSSELPEAKAPPLVSPQVCQGVGRPKGCPGEHALLLDLVAVVVPAMTANPNGSWRIISF